MTLLPTIALSLLTVAMVIGLGNLLAGAVVLAWERAREALGL